MDLNVALTKGDLSSVVTPPAPPVPTIQVTGPNPAQGTVATNFVYTVSYTNVSNVNLQNSDITLGGTDTTGCSHIVTNGNTTSATVTISNCSGDGTVNFSIAADTAEDADGNKAPAYSSSADAAIKNAFIITIDTTLGNGLNSFSAPTTGWGGVNFDVDWGDGATQNVVNPGGGPVTHNYSSPGIYEIKFTGALRYFQFYGGGDALKVIDVKQWGTIQWWNVELMFSGCENMVMSATDAPDLSQVTNMRGMFMGSKKFNTSINHWDTSTITDMRDVFADAILFNQELDNWNTASVTSMRSMFSNARAFNRNLSSWNTAAVTDMGFMFYDAKSFNSPLIRSGNSWNTSSVTTMDSMFAGAEVFNQSLSTWVFGSITNMDSLFKDAYAFDQDLSGWIIPGGPGSVSHNLYDDFAISWQPQHKPTFP